MVRWLLMFHAVHPVWLIGLQALHGITFGAFWLAAVAMVSKRAPDEIATSAQGLLSASVGGMGAALGMVGGSIVVEYWSTEWVFAFGAAMAVLANLVCVLMRRAEEGER